MRKYMPLKLVGALAAASLCAASLAAAHGPSVAAGSAQPAGELAPGGGGGSLLAGESPFTFVLGAAFAALIIYGIYDVLVEDDNEDRPASP